MHRRIDLAVHPLRSIVIAVLASLLWCSGASAAAPVKVKAPPGWPQVVSLARLSVVAKIEPIAMKRMSDIDAPHRMDEVAWYSRGHRPGDRGRAEIFGHLDSTCCPAIFYHLRDMKKGDLVQVQYKTGKPLTFRVRWQATYLRTHMPLAFMYGPTTDHGLMLVTCAGIFHRDGTGYDHRLMVYATLVS
jgi:sortase A